MTVEIKRKPGWWLQEMAEKEPEALSEMARKGGKISKRRKSA